MKDLPFPVSSLAFASEELTDYGVISVQEDNRTIFAFLTFRTVQTSYTVSVFEKKTPASPLCQNLDSGSLSVSVSDTGELSQIQYNGKPLGGAGFLDKYIVYGGKKYPFGKGVLSAPVCAGSVRGVCVRGDIHLPGEAKPGQYRYTFFTVGSAPAVFAAVTVQYPYTPETTSISTENSALGRYTDKKWTETAPFQLTPALQGDIKVLKRNFADAISSYRVHSFPESDPLNDSLDSFNHHLTCGMVGLFTDSLGVIVANSRQTLGSMAHCPMRLEKNGVVRMNPFGTYYGKQRHHASRSKGEILNAYTLIAVQGQSLAPAYNGVSETALLGLYGFSGGNPNEETLRAVKAFSDGAVVSAPADAWLQPDFGDNVTFPEAKPDAVEESRLKSPMMTGFAGNAGKYIKYGVKAIAHILKEQIKSR